MPNLGCRGAESLGWFDVLPKNSAQDMIHKQEHYCDKAANQQLPTAVDFWIVQIASLEECSNLTQNLMQMHCSTQSVYSMYTCSLKDGYLPHWLGQWSHHCSLMCTPVPSPWLPGYIDVTQTILIVLTMAGLFLDRTCSLLRHYKIHHLL